MLIFAAALFPGVLLSFRFRTLLPSILVCGLILFAIAGIDRVAIWAITWRAILLLVGILVGYCCGTSARLWNAAVSAPTAAWLQRRQRIPH